MSWSSKLFLDLGYNLTKYLAAKEKPVLPLMPITPQSTRMIPISKVFGDIPMNDLLVNDPIPELEKQWVKKAFANFLSGMARTFQRIDPNSETLPGPPSEWIQKILDPTTISLANESSIFVRPECFTSETPDLGQLVFEGPFFIFLSKSNQAGEYLLDLSEFSSYRHHEFCFDTGAIVTFRLNSTTRRMEATEITLTKTNQKLLPNDADWIKACRIVCSGLIFSNLVLEHATKGHYATACPSSFALYQMADHPLKRLLWPHIQGSIIVATHLAPNLFKLPPAGAFHDFFSFERDALYDLIQSTYKRSDFFKPDPFKIRNELSDLMEFLPTSTLADACRLMEIISDYTAEYIDKTFETDIQVTQDKEIVTFLGNLKNTVPNFPDLPLNKNTLKEVFRVLIYRLSVEHHFTAAHLWSYVVHPGHMAGHVPSKLKYISVDRFRHFIHVFYAATLPARQLTDANNYTGIEEPFREINRKFLASLEKMGTEMDKEKLTANRLHPRKVRIAADT